jgi:hypothetical protein
VPSVRVIRSEEQAPPPPPEPPADAEEPPPPLVHFGPRRVLGVNVSAGVAHLAVVEAPRRPLLELTGTLVPALDLEFGARLVEFSGNVKRTMRDLNRSAVAIARPLRYTNWRYADALERASLETCFMMEAHRLALRFESVGQHHAANVVGLPLDRLDDALPAKFHIDKTSRWAERYPALLVALAVAMGNLD